MPSVDWAALLAQHNLESPGRQEAVQTTLDAIAAKKEKARLELLEKKQPKKSGKASRR